jgi:hypothetical protein
MSFIYDLAVTGRDWRRRRIHITSFSQFTTHLFFVVKYGGDPRGTLFQISKDERPCPTPCPLASRLLCFKGYQFLLVRAHSPRAASALMFQPSPMTQCLSTHNARGWRPTNAFGRALAGTVSRRTAIMACSLFACTPTRHPCHFAAHHLPCARPPDATLISLLASVALTAFACG